MKTYRFREGRHQRTICQAIAIGEKAVNTAVFFDCVDVLQLLFAGFMRTPVNDHL